LKYYNIIIIVLQLFYKMSKTKKVSNEININEEINKIIELYKSKQINNYDFNKLLNLNLFRYVLFLETISKIIYTTQGHQESDKNFKLSYFSNLVILLIKSIKHTVKEPS